MPFVICAPNPAAAPLASPTFRAAGVSNYDWQTSVTINQPATTQVGDFLLIHIMWQSERGSLVVPSGWTLLDSITSSHWYWRIADTAGTVGHTWSWAGHVDRQAGIGAWYSPNARPIVIDTHATRTNAGSNSMVFPSISPTTAASTLICSGAPGNIVTVVADSPLTERWNQSQSFASTWGGDQPLAASGATGTRSATMSTTQSSRTISLAIAEDEP